MSDDRSFLSWTETELDEERQRTEKFFSSTRKVLDQFLPH
jgi:hypothetical protein